MTVDAGESMITGAAEVACRLTDAAAVWSAHVRRDVPHPSLGVVGRHGNSATVNYCQNIYEKEN